MRTRRQFGVLTPWVAASALAGHVALQPAPAQTTALHHAISARQCTRGDDEAAPLSGEVLKQLEPAGNTPDVRMLLITDRPAMARVLDHVVQANTAQLADPAFVKELKRWARFNASDAARTRDGLFSACTGKPALPAWLAGWPSVLLTGSSRPTAKTTRRRARCARCANRQAWRCSSAASPRQRNGLKWAALMNALRCRPRRWASATPS